MRKQEIEQCLSQSWEVPQSISNLRVVVQEIEQGVPSEATREMLYDLVASLLAMGERLREVELRMAGGNPVEEMARREERRNVEIRKGLR